MIKLTDITHLYQNKPVLQNLHLNIEANKITCLLGSSGSGKTTILRLIAGLEVPVLGQISIQEKVLTVPDEIIVPPHQRKLGYVFQDLALWPHFTVYKNIAFGLEEQKTKDIKIKVYEMLEYFALKDHAKKYPHQLSGGQKQLVAIARSLILNPKILLMDEPFSNLDIKLKRKMLSHIKKLKQKFNLTIVYVTHDHKEAFAIADSVVVLNNGIIEQSGTIEQIKKSENEFVNDFIEY